jgi:hypothetical protein
VFRATTSRPLSNLNVVSIAELAKFTAFDPKSGITVAQAADAAIRKEWKLEILMHDLEYLDWEGLRVFFTDGSSLTLEQKK